MNGPKKNISTCMCISVEYPPKNSNIHRNISFSFLQYLKNQKLDTQKKVMTYFSTYIPRVKR